jgi:tripartite-type tricarboxylate transporter receptor subunit TctC
LIRQSSLTAAAGERHVVGIAWIESETTDTMPSLFPRLHRRARLPIACVLLQLAVAAPLSAEPVADYSRGRTLTLVSGFTPNGENDAYLRHLGRHVDRFIPGNPSVVPRNMPGGGTMVAANHMYKAAAPDGTVMGMFLSQAAVEPFLGNKAALFDPLKFGWIGGLALEPQFCAVAPGPGVPETFDDLLQKETVFGASAPTSDIYRFTAVLKNVLGARIRMVSGYPGMPGVTLALQRGEVSGACGFTATALRTRLAPALQNGQMKLLVQLGGAPTSEFGKVPNAFDYARTDEARELLDYFFGALRLGRLIAVPPGVPNERLHALRTAFASVLRDPAFLAEASKLNLVIDAASATDLQTQMVRLSKYPPAFFERAQKAHH